ncbi:TetR/AcrR family transcriptional regulator [Saccharothrix coeruleofusca]|uniref:TetR/AcrR family transcriptional regulator n=1 Tax=Saccharothrix coeruleofusca TaxID=33919 RepID=UPI00167030D7|nr:TetR/AcrR family transcriptional regulator [Saccharothrix coeruleofusca]
MARRNDTRDRVVRTAAALFRSQGYHATGLNQVLAEGGAPKGSLYFHFPGGKEQLAAEAVAHAGQELGDALREVLARQEDPVEALRSALWLLSEGLVASDFRDGCPVATVALDAAAQSETIRRACAGVYDGWRSAIAEHLRTRFPDADELATVVLAAIEGALLLARTRRDLSPVDAVAARLGALLGKATP